MPPVSSLCLHPLLFLALAGFVLPSIFFFWWDPSDQVEGVCGRFSLASSASSAFLARSGVGPNTCFTMPPCSLMCIMKASCATAGAMPARSSTYLGQRGRAGSGEAEDARACAAGAFLPQHACARACAAGASLPQHACARAAHAVDVIKGIQCLSQHSPPPVVVQECLPPRSSPTAVCAAPFPAVAQGPLPPYSPPVAEAAPNPHLVQGRQVRSRSLSRLSLGSFARAARHSSRSSNQPCESGNAGIGTSALLTGVARTGRLKASPPPPPPPPPRHHALAPHTCSVPPSSWPSQTSWQSSCPRPSTITKSRGRAVPMATRMALVVGG